MNFVQILCRFCVEPQCMKKILGIVVLSFLWLNTVAALPNCIGDYSYKWTMCEAKKIFSYGEYFGEFRDGQMHGQGTLTSLDGSKYNGEWKNNERHGYGTFTYQDGSKYIGEWMKSEHRYGTFIKKNGSGKKVGQFKKGKFIK